MLDFFGFIIIIIIIIIILKQNPAAMLDFFFGNKVTQNWVMSAKRVGLGKFGYF